MTQKLTPERLRQYRRENRYSLQLLASVLGIHYSTLWRYERGILPIPPYLNFALDPVFFWGLGKKNCELNQ